MYKLAINRPITTLFDAAQILLTAKRQTLFTEQGGRVNLTQRPVLAKAQNV